MSCSGVHSADRQAPTSHTAHSRVRELYGGNKEPARQQAAEPRRISQELAPPPLVIERVSPASSPAPGSPVVVVDETPAESITSLFRQKPAASPKPGQRGTAPVMNLDDSDSGPE
jgi:hypothetical protein